MIYIKIKLASHRKSKILVGLLGNEQIFVLKNISQKSKFVLGFFQHLPCELQIIAGFAYQIQRYVGECNVLFQNWSMPTPLRQPMAQNERTIAQL